MADNTTKYTAEIDIDTSASIAELKKLKKELRSIPLDTEEFKVAQARINDIEDSLKGARTGADNFVEVLGQLPGPIGNIGASVAGTVQSLKTFSSLKLGDLRSSFTELSKDLVDIGKGLFRLTGLNKLYALSNAALSKTFVQLGVSEQAAAAGARSLSAALIATGIGALVVALGFAIAKLVEFATSTEESDAAAKSFNDTLEEQERLLQNDAAALDSAAKAAITRAKIAGKSEAEIAEIQKKFNKEKLEGLRAYDNELYKQQKALDKNTKLSAEEKTKLNDELNKKILKSGQDITKQILENGQFELDTQLAAKERANAKSKTITEKGNATQKQLIEQRNKDIQAAEKVAVESYIQTLTDRDKDVYKRGQELNEDLVTLEKGKDAAIAEARRKGIKNTKAIEERYTADVLMAKEAYKIDVQKIEEKYNKEDLDKLEEQQKKVTEFDSKVAEIRISAIKNEVERSKAERQKKYDDELAELESDKEFVKRSEEEKNEIRKNLKIALENDLAKIDDDAKLKKSEKDIKALDDELRLLELRSAGLINGTKAYFEARAAILDAEEAKELAKVDLTEAEKTAIKEKYTRLREQLDEDEIASYGKVISATLDSLAAVTTAIASGYDEEAKTSKEAFEKRKKLQKATAILSAASGIVQILTQPSTLPSPFDWIVKGVNAVALGISTAVQIKNIDKAQFDGGGSGSTSSNPVASAPAPTIPTLAKTPVPQIPGTTGGNNPTSQIAQTLSKASDKPVKAYVVSGDVTSQQALDRRTTRAATFSG
jgi:hypothetical protein